MHTFEFVSPEDPAEAVAAAAKAKTAQKGADIRILAGGTTLIDLMKLNVEQPARLVRRQSPGARQDRGDSRGRAEDRSDGHGTRHSRTTRNRAGATTRSCRRLFFRAPRRNSGTWPHTAGNLLQRTRCVLLPRHRHAVQQAGARDGVLGHRRPAIGRSPSSARGEQCIATNPSDMCRGAGGAEANDPRSKGRRARARCRSPTSISCTAARPSARPCSSHGDPRHPRDAAGRRSREVVRCT